MLPTADAWLAREPGPKMLVEALKLFGTLETQGPKSNPAILGWAREIGVEKIYTGDEIAWCGLFVGAVAKRAGKPLPKSPLWARDWLNWGSGISVPELGDVLVFARGSGGHVALYVGEDGTHFHILGGNQSDQVSIVRKAKAELLGARRLFAIGKPANVRRVLLSSGGAPVSGKES